MKKERTNNRRELLAQITLKTALPKEFSDIELSDKPDLIKKSSGLGIEVVFATDQKEEQLSSYYEKFLYGKTIREVPEKGLANFRSHSYDVIVDKNTLAICACKMVYTPFDINVIYTAINKKMQKLNAGLYNYSDNISLYIQTFKYSIDLAALSTAENILKYANSLKRKYNLSYKEVFYDCCFVLYRLNLEKSTITEIDLNDHYMNILEQFNAINGVKNHDQL